MRLTRKVFFPRIIVELRHYNELYRWTNKVKHALRYYFTENPLEQPKGEHNNTIEKHSYRRVEKSRCSFNY